MIKPFTLTQETTTTYEKKAIGGEASLYLGATTVNPVEAFDGQFFTKTSVTRGIYLFTSHAWVRQTTPTNDMISRASYDIMAAVNAGLGSITDYTASGVNFQLAIIQNLFVGSIIITVTAGSNIIKNANRQITTTSNSYGYVDLAVGYATSYKTIPWFLMAANGTVRVSFDLATKNSAGYAYARITKNSSNVGIERSVNTITAQTFIEDISISAGDRLGISMKCDVSAENAYVSNYTVGISENTGILPYFQDA